VERRRGFRIVSFRPAWLLALVICSGLPAVPGPAELALDSPFTAQSGPAAGRVRPGPFELRGFMVSNDGARYCIYNTATAKSAWAAVGEQGHPFLLLSGDADGGRVTIQFANRIITVAMRQSRVGAEPDRGPTEGAQEDVAVHSRDDRLPGAPRAPTPAATG
jgi:hypothetical protein